MGTVQKLAEKVKEGIQTALPKLRKTVINKLAPAVRVMIAAANIERFGKAWGGGLILLQLPPRWHVNPECLQAFLSHLPAEQCFAFELRDPR